MKARRLLAFSRRQSISPRIIDIAARVRDMRGVLEQSVQADIRLEISTPSHPVAVNVDPEEQEMALNSRGPCRREDESRLRSPTKQ